MDDNEVVGADKLHKVEHLEILARAWKETEKLEVNTLTRVFNDAIIRGETPKRCNENILIRIYSEEI